MHVDFNFPALAMSEPILWGLGIRDFLLLAAAFAAVYIVVVLLRLIRLRYASKRPPPPVEPRLATRQEPAPAPRVAAPRNEVAESRPRPASGPMSTPMPSFDDALNHVALEGRVQTLTYEVQALREDVARLQAEVKKLDAARNVSPLYGEAVSLAQQGMDAASVAVRCGISIAEAELVTSLTAQSRASAGMEPYHDEELS